MTPEPMPWESRIRKWQSRLLRDSSWEVYVQADASLPNRAQVAVNVGSRCATVSYSPFHVPNTRTACHEIVHILVRSLSFVAETAAQRLPEPADGIALDLLNTAEEELVEKLTDLFMAAYEHNGDKP